MGCRAMLKAARGEGRHEIPMVRADEWRDAKKEGEG